MTTNSFEPRITIEPSKTYPGEHVWLFHIPGGRLPEVGGKIGVVGRSVAVELYVKRLSRFNHLCGADDVDCPEPTPAHMPLPSPAAARPRKQREVVLDALRNGAVTSHDVSRDTGLAPNNTSALLSILEARGEAHRVGFNNVGPKGARQIIWAAGPGEKEDKQPDEDEDEDKSQEDPKDRAVPSATVKSETRSAVKADTVTPDTPVRRDTRTAVVKFASGGCLELSLDCNAFLLTEDERAFLFDLVDRVANYPGTRSAAA